MSDALMILAAVLIAAFGGAETVTRAVADPRSSQRARRRRLAQFGYR